MNLHYQIRFKEHLDPSWSTWFDGLSITHEQNGESVLIGPLPDQSALYGVLEKARNLNLTLVAVAETPSSPPTIMEPTDTPSSLTSSVDTEKGTSNG